VGQIFNLGSDEEITIMQLAQRVKRITGSRSEIVTIPYGEAYEEGFEDMARRVPDLSKIRDFLGYAPRIELDQMIREIWELRRSGHP
jgi:UDP-glucose 4-epimerase